MLEDSRNISGWSEVIDAAILDLQRSLSELALSEDFWKRMALTFGDGFDAERIEKFRQRDNKGDFEKLLNIEFL